VLTRIRQAFIPKDPLYRRESGAGRRVALVAKLTGLVAVLGASLYWAVMVLSQSGELELATALVAQCSWVFCAVALVLGVQSVCGETAGGTAEALVLTPESRWRLATAKLAGSAEFLVVAALLVPLYCSSLWSLTDLRDISALLAGGLLRAAAAAERWRPDGESCLPLDIALGLAGFAGDLAWYALFAACGIAAAVWARGRAAAWLAGLLLALAFFGVFTVYDGLVTGRLGDLAAYLGLASLLPEIRDWSLGWLSLALVVVSIGTRLYVAHRLLRLAARHFDRIATD
jgi:hypothetical protein